MTATSLYKFPQDPTLAKLLVAAAKFPSSETIFHDIDGFQKTYPQLLGDVVRTSKNLRTQLPISALNKLGYLEENVKNITFVSESSYEFLVAFLAIRVIGGICVPLGSKVLPEEGKYFLEKVKAKILLFGRDCVDQVQTIRDYMKTPHGSTLVLVPISCDAEPVSPDDISFDTTTEMRPDAAGLIMFTSGTTGLPKAVVLRRSCLSRFNQIQPGGATLNNRPGNWMLGLMNLIGPIISGQKLYALGGKGSPEIVLEMLRTHRITHMSFVPHFLRQMRDYMTNGSGKLSSEEEENYARYFEHLSTIRCGGASLDPSLKNFWTKLTKLSFTNGYGATEFGGYALITASLTQDSLGTQPTEMEIKLSEGDHGEILVKSPGMFLCYIDDEAQTKAAFDEDGYFKTGDLAELKNGEYIFTGRASSDCIVSNSYRFSALNVEKALTNLSYISDACVLGVPDRDARQLCGAVVRLCSSQEVVRPINLERIRSDVDDELALYMQPTLLRILADGEDLPRTISGKPIKRKILTEYFGTTDWFPNDAAPKNIELYVSNKTQLTASKAWDWSGIY